MIKSRKWIYRKKDGSNTEGDIQFSHPVTEKEVREQVPFQREVRRGPHVIIEKVKVELIPFEKTMTAEQKKLRAYLREINKWQTVPEIEELSEVGINTRNALDALYHEGELLKSQKVEGTTTISFFKYNDK